MAHGGGCGGRWPRKAGGSELSGGREPVALRSVLRGAVKRAVRKAEGRGLAAGCGAVCVCAVLSKRGAGRTEAV